MDYRLSLRSFRASSSKLGLDANILASTLPALLTSHIIRRRPRGMDLIKDSEPFSFDYPWPTRLHGI